MLVEVMRWAAVVFYTGGFLCLLIYLGLCIWNQYDGYCFKHSKGRFKH